MATLETCYLNGQVLQHGQRIKITAKTGKSDKCGECVCNVCPLN